MEKTTIQLTFASIEPCIKSLTKLMNQLNGLTTTPNLEKKVRSKMQKIHEHCVKQLLELKVFLTKYNNELVKNRETLFDKQYEQKYQQLKTYRRILEGKIETLELLKFKTMKEISDFKTVFEAKNNEVLHLTVKLNEQKIEIENMKGFFEEDKKHKQKLISILQELNIVNNKKTCEEINVLEEIIKQLMEKKREDQIEVNQLSKLAQSQSLTQLELDTLYNEIHSFNLQDSDTMFFGYQINKPFLSQLSYVLNYDFKDLFKKNYKHYIARLSKKSSAILIKILSILCSTFGGKSVLWYRNYVSERFYETKQYKRDKKCKILKFYYTYVNPTNEENEKNEHIKEFCKAGDIQRKQLYIEYYRQLDLEIRAKATLHFSEPIYMLKEYKEFREFYYRKDIDSQLTKQQIKDNEELCGA
jgi:hypothetical protein